VAHSRRASSLFELSKMSEAELAAIMGQMNGKRLHVFLHRRQ
jgi:hypothetical protein